MTEIRVTDRAENYDNFIYLEKSLREVFEVTGSDKSVEREGGRAIFKVFCPEDIKETVKNEVCDKAAEIIAVNYKYKHLKEHVKAAGLTAEQKDIFFAGVIGADFYEDKKYIYETLKGFYDIALDGIYNFRLGRIKEKTAEIVRCIPSCFTEGQLSDFITFLTMDKRNKVYVDKGMVFDGRFRRLKRSTLMGRKEPSVVAEVLIAEGGVVEVDGEIGETDERYLKEFFGSRVYFSQKNYR
ncbi:MAG: hypothetical protein IK147_01450 [Clostridia bacterium]|nr:hypothetical protein [Clostridia bacterium]